MRREAAKPRHFAQQNAGEPQQRLSRAVGARRFGGVGKGRAERKPRRPPTKGGAFCEAKCGGPSGGGRIAERHSRLSQSSSLSHSAQRRSRHDSADSFSCRASAKSAKHGARRKRRRVRLSPPLSAAFASANARAPRIIKRTARAVPLAVCVIVWLFHCECCTSRPFCGQISFRRPDFPCGWLQ